MHACILQIINTFFFKKKVEVLLKIFLGYDGLHSKAVWYLESRVSRAWYGRAHNYFTLLMSVK